MLKRPLALAVAASLALTSLTPAPARAGDDDVLPKVIFGAIGFAMLAQAIADAERRREANVTNNYIYRQQPQPHVRQPHVQRPQPQRQVTVSRPPAATVPAACIRNLDTQRGPRSFVGRRCLTQRGVQTAQLPQACQRELDFGRRDVNAWNVGCLRENGYRLN